MIRVSFTFIFILITTQICFSQTQSIKDSYFEFLQVRTEFFKTDEAIKQGLALLKRSEELNEKQIASLTYHLGRLYEAEEDMENALPYYEKSIKLSPDYYVPYRALGFWYFKAAVDMEIGFNKLDQKKDAPLYNKAKADYKKLALKTLFYLEKAQACDPDEETLSMILDLYKAIGDKNRLPNLKDRLKSLERNCVTLLDDE